MGESTSTDPKHFPHGKSPGRKAGRPKPLKRRSMHGTGSGDSTPRILTPTDNKAKEKEMAASFLQYCAMCEKQIMTPCNSILYCSEACRRKDSAKPLSASSIASPPRAASIPASPHPTTLPVHTASTSPPVYDTPALRIPADIHDAKSDLDPTEWKPKLERRGQSEAFRYLSRFNHTMNASASDTPPRHDVQQLERPATWRHRSTMSMSMSTSTSTTTMTTPSLGNTPTTTASSFDSIYYDFNLRPLPPRQNPLYSTGAGTYKGIDLVTPHIPPPLDVDTVGSGSVPTVALDNDFWGKKAVVPGSTPQGNGLRALFGKDN
ncbi:hypothetical protein A1O3_01617 [Capronia epimyces CBS 606.96]|uniref:Uncharacterized protein n=1 Tax=Capronia epimyces CBS 606.96 TaxID=1182542 RepID=W9YUX3_9EURO|nr:uncharacterized protein A1O3_01617 [Capronia epimyces CBS 606.96]EXJ93061.1 hypothetical protein A1O3_01617 [Capronia epimyces CBS 606.96]